MYGRKVEYLHALVHRALAHVADPKAGGEESEGGGGGAGPRTARAPAVTLASALAAAADDDAAFLALDGLVEAAGVHVTDLDDKDQAAPPDGAASAARATARPPAVLLALDDASAEGAPGGGGAGGAGSAAASAAAAGPNAAGAGSVTLRIAQLGVHAPSGALLLDPRDGDGLGPGLEAGGDGGGGVSGDWRTAAAALGDGAALLEAVAAQARLPLPLLAAGGSAPAPAFSDDDGGAAAPGGGDGPGDSDDDDEGGVPPPPPAAFGPASESRPPLSLFTGGGGEDGPPPPDPDDPDDPFAPLDPALPGALAVKPYCRLARPPPRRAQRADARGLASSALTAAAVWAPSWGAAAAAHPAWLPPPPSRLDALTLPELAVHRPALARLRCGVRRRARAGRAGRAGQPHPAGEAAAAAAASSSSSSSDDDGEGAGLDLIDADSGGEEDGASGGVTAALDDCADGPDVGGWLDSGWGGGHGGAANPAAPENAEEEDELSYEALVRAHVEALVAAAAAAGSQTALAARVADWRAKVGPALEAGEAHGPFDMWAEGAAVRAAVLRAVDSDDDAQNQDSGDEGTAAAATAGLEAVLGGQPRWRVARLFAATLQLAAARSVAVCRRPDGSVGLRPLEVVAAGTVPVLGARQGGGGGGRNAAGGSPTRSRAAAARARARAGSSSPPSSGNPAPKKRSRRPSKATPAAALEPTAAASRGGRRASRAA